MRVLRRPTVLGRIEELGRSRPPIAATPLASPAPPSALVEEVRASAAGLKLTAGATLVPGLKVTLETPGRYKVTWVVDFNLTKAATAIARLFVGGVEQAPAAIFGATAAARDTATQFHVIEIADEKVLEIKALAAASETAEVPTTQHSAMLVEELG